MTYSRKRRNRPKDWISLREHVKKGDRHAGVITADLGDIGVVFKKLARRSGVSFRVAMIEAASDFIKKHGGRVSMPPQLTKRGRRPGTPIVNPGGPPSAKRSEPNA